jgi:hypothetical protein
LFSHPRDAFRLDFQKQDVLVKHAAMLPSWADIGAYSVIRRGASGGGQGPCHSEVIARSATSNATALKEDSKCTMR